MRGQILLLLALVTSITSFRMQLGFISDCKCVKMDLENGIEITDDSGRFQVMFPNKNWQPQTYGDEFSNGIVGAILSENSFKSFEVTELLKDKNWKKKEEQQADIESKYNVIESGLTKINGIESLWNLVDFKNDSIPSLTLYVTTEHPTENLFYTLGISVSKDKYGKKELCELEDLIKSFKIK